MSTNGRPQVVVLGGGFGGLESAFYLQYRLRGKAKITIVSDQDYFLFKPNTIYIPFGLDPDKLKIPLEQPVRRKGYSFVLGQARAIDTDRQQVSLDGRTLDYDYLIVSTGAGMRPQEVPGLAEYAETIWTPADMAKLGREYRRIVENAKQSRRQHVLFLIPPFNRCSGPLYEMVQMFETWLRRRGVRDMVEITWTTSEMGYIQAFGPRLDAAVTAEFAQRGITGYKQKVVAEVQTNKVIYQDDSELPYDLLVSFPPYVAAQAFRGLPADDRGFISTNLETRQVAGHPNIYAVGDAADFPVKQAFLALLQGDAAAEHLASEILHRQPSTDFDPVSMCVMEQFDKATFAQVPLRLTGDRLRPVEVRPDADGAYRVGSSMIWRAGKTLLGVYLPFRFRAGNPFHAGIPWKGMDAGLKVMSRVLAS